MGFVVTFSYMCLMCLLIPTHPLSFSPPVGLLLFPNALPRFLLSCLFLKTQTPHGKQKFLRWRDGDVHVPKEPSGLLKNRGITFLSRLSAPASRAPGQRNGS